MTGDASAGGGVSLGPRQEFLAHHLRRVLNSMLSGGIIEGLEGLGLRPALLEILSIIAVNPGISASAAGQAAGVKQPNVGKLIRELLDKNFIERRPSASDRRATELAITPSGDALVAKAHQLVREHQDRTMAPLSQDESKLLINLLSRL